MISIPLETAKAAELEHPRPGLWWQPRIGCVGDGRELSQDHTDIAIAREVDAIITALRVDYVGTANPVTPLLMDIEQYHQLADLWLRQPIPCLERSEYPIHEAKMSVMFQRGGLHSDPMIRTYARHYFGDRDRLWHDQPICACGHEAGLHQEHDPHSSQPNYHRCLQCNCTFSAARVRELAGPTCTCPPWNAAPGRFVRTNCGGPWTHSMQCEKGAWYRAGIAAAEIAAADARYLRAGVITSEEIARSWFKVDSG